MTEIDENFICGKCQGTLAPTGEETKGRKIYQCSSCGSSNGKQIECPVCHYPRRLWVKQGDREVCSFCSNNYYFEFTEICERKVGDYYIDLIKSIKDFFKKIKVVLN